MYICYTGYSQNIIARTRFLLRLHLQCRFGLWFKGIYTRWKLWFADVLWRCIISFTHLGNDFYNKHIVTVLVSFIFCIFLFKFNNTEHDPFGICIVWIPGHTGSDSEYNSFLFLSNFIWTKSWKAHTMYMHKKAFTQSRPGWQDR